MGITSFEQEKIEHLQSEEVQEYLLAQEQKSPIQVALATSPFSFVSSADLAQQIAGRQTAKKKFPFLARTPAILYPPKLNLEQTSSEVTAEYKASLLSGASLVDVSGGWGVDTLAFARNFKQVTHLEQHEALQVLAKANFQTLGCENIQSYAQSSELFLQQDQGRYDWLYADPSRRNGAKQRVVQLQDLQPNVLACKSLWFAKVKQGVLLKLSPMLDIAQALKELPETKTVCIVAVKNEVKELLFVLGKSPLPPGENVKLLALNLQSDQPSFSCLWGENVNSPAYSAPLKYLYLPNSAVAKSNGFAALAKQYTVKKLAPFTHVFTSDVYRPNFPGEVFLNQGNVENPKKFFKGKSLRIIARNYPLKAPQIAKKYKCRQDGIEPYLFAGTQQKKVILALEVVK